MQELDSYLNLGQERMILMKSEVGIEVEKENVCSAECESMVHVLCECSAYSSSRTSFIM